MKEFLRIVKFTLVSISAALIDGGSFALLTLFIDSQVICTTISTILSVIWNFTINRKVTFKSSSNIPLAMLLVGTFYLVFLPAQALFVKYVPMNEYLAKAICMVSNLVLEYIYTRYVVYRNTCDTVNDSK